MRTFRSEYELPLEYLKLKINLKFDSFCCEQRSEQELINMLQMKIFISSVKRYQTEYKFKKSVCKN